MKGPVLQALCTDVQKQPLGCFFYMAKVLMPSRKIKDSARLALHNAVMPLTLVDARPNLAWRHKNE